MTVTPIPPGYTSLTPFLCVDGAAAAINFYVSVFGARLVDRMDGDGDTVAHAELDFGDRRLHYFAVFAVLAVRGETINIVAAAA